jgi:hypothetical protein
MNQSFVLVSLSLACVVIVLAFIREARLRRALQKLLSRLLIHWRNNHAATGPQSSVGRNPSDGPDQRL